MNRSPFSPFDPCNYGRFRPLPTSAITKDFPDYQSRHNIESTPKTTKSTGYPAGYTSEEYFKDPGASDETPGTINSTTSDDDLRAIEKGMQRLLEPEMVEGGKELMEVSDQKERKEVQDSGKLPVLAFESLPWNNIYHGIHGVI